MQLIQTGPQPLDRRETPKDSSLKREEEGKAGRAVGLYKRVGTCGRPGLQRRRQGAGRAGKAGAGQGRSQQSVGEGVGHVTGDIGGV